MRVNQKGAIKPGFGISRKHCKDPPKSPLKRGTLNSLVPPFLRGARGDLRGQKTRPSSYFQAKSIVLLEQFLRQAALTLGVKSDVPGLEFGHVGFPGYRLVAREQQLVSKSDHCQLLGVLGERYSL